MSRCWIRHLCCIYRMWFFMNISLLHRYSPSERLFYFVHWFISNALLNIEQICQKKCLNHLDSICYICGNVAFKEQWWNLIPLIKNYYELYFSCKVKKINIKNWTAHIFGVSWIKRLTEWAEGSRHINFAVPNNCGVSHKIIHQISYNIKQHIVIEK